jgi:hypothetical protein
LDPLLGSEDPQRPEMRSALHQLNSMELEISLSGAGKPSPLAGFQSEQVFHLGMSVVYSVLRGWFAFCGCAGPQSPV